MKFMFDKLFPEKLYQSYVLEGEPEDTAKELLKYLEYRGEISKGSHDVLFQVHEAFTINETTVVKDWNSKHEIDGYKKICIIASKFINREAEQALLKVIEEPAQNTHLFIIVPDASVLSSTIISRVHIVKIKDIKTEEIKEISKDFIRLSTKARLDKVSMIIKENKNEENTGQLRSFAISFINEIEKSIHDEFKKNKNNKNIIFILEELEKSRNFLYTPGASVKMILEHLSLVI